MLTIEHITPYLHSNMLISNGIRHDLRLFGIKNHTIWVFVDTQSKSKPSYQLPLNINEVKPLLRPLSDLCQPYTQNKSVLFIQVIDPDLAQITNEQLLMDMANQLTQNIKNKTILLHTAQALFKHRFDVFGLIPKGLALDENVNYGR
jgi:hypothetical protein